VKQFVLGILGEIAERAATDNLDRRRIRNAQIAKRQPLPSSLGI